MFLNIDKVIEESNKELLYGEKPKVPDELKCNIGVITSSETNDKQEFLQPPTNTEIMDKINEIIKYLEWLDK